MRSKDIFKQVNDTIGYSDSSANIHILFLQHNRATCNSNIMGKMNNRFIW